MIASDASRDRRTPARPGHTGRSKPPRARRARSAARAFRPCFARPSSRLLVLAEVVGLAAGLVLLLDEGLETFLRAATRRARGREKVRHRGLVLDPEAARGDLA